MSQTIEQAKEALSNANAAFDDEMKRDSERGWGSERQERLREDRQKKLSDEVDRCRRNLENAEKSDLSI